MKITLAAETPGDTGTTFQLFFEDALVGEGLTAVQSHLLIGAIIDRLAEQSARQSPPRDQNCSQEARSGR